MIPAYYVWLEAEVSELRAEIEGLTAPFRFVDADDWEYVMRALDGCGRNAFWRQVLTETRAALEPKP